MSKTTQFDPREEPMLALYVLALGWSRLFREVWDRGGQVTPQEAATCRLAAEGMLWMLEGIDGVQSRALDLDVPHAKWRAAELLEVELRNTKGDQL